MAQMLQTAEGESVRDKSLNEMVCDCVRERLHIVLDPFIRHVQMKNIHLGISTLERLLGRLEKLLEPHEFSRSEAAHLIAIRILIASSHLWVRELADDCNVVSMVEDLLEWLTTSFLKDKTGSWIVRDALVRLFDRYIRLDPTMDFWHKIEKKGGSALELPDMVLAEANKDKDIRVRFVSAYGCAQLFSGPYIRCRDAMGVYKSITETLCLTLEE